MKKTKTKKGKRTKLTEILRAKPCPTRHITRVEVLCAE